MIEENQVHNPLEDFFSINIVLPLPHDSYPNLVVDIDFSSPYAKLDYQKLKYWLEPHWFFQPPLHLRILA